MFVYQSKNVLYIRCVLKAWKVLEKHTHLFTYVEKLRVSGSIRTKILHLKPQWETSTVKLE